MGSMDNKWPGIELDIIKELRKADYDDFLIFEVEFCADNKTDYQLFVSPFGEIEK